VTDDDRWDFHTTGSNCHWCHQRKTAFTWGPYDTNVCNECQQLIQSGSQWDVVEGVAAHITVRGGWFMTDPETWRAKEHVLMARWLEIRTTCRPAATPE
jgi:3-methyladenine DNA glycosylase AlkD